MAIEVGATAATMGLEWLAAYLKRKVDERMANQQIAAFKAIAKKSINANPDKAVKLMLGDPYRTIYAWIHLDSSVISTLGLDPWGQPTLSDSAPLFDLSGIEYQPMPMDPALVDLLPKFSTGATHITVTRPMVIDLPLTTPSFEELISYAKAHNLPLDDANAYAFTRLQAASTTLHNILESNQKILGSKQELIEIIKQSQAQLKIAKKLRNAELQKTIENNIASATEKMNSIKGVDPETIQKSSREVAYWEHLNDITKPSMPKP